MIINGILRINWEYSEEILWNIEDNERMYILQDKDILKVVDGDHEIYHGEIEFEIVNRMICGFQVNRIQKTVDPEQWFGWFYMNSKALLIRKEF